MRGVGERVKAGRLPSKVRANSPGSDICKTTACACLAVRHVVGDVGAIPRRTNRQPATTLWLRGLARLAKQPRLLARAWPRRCTCLEQLGLQGSCGGHLRGQPPFAAVHPQTYDGKRMGLTGRDNSCRNGGAVGGGPLGTYIAATRTPRSQDGVRQATRAPRARRRSQPWATRHFLATFNWCSRARGAKRANRWARYFPRPSPSIGV